MAKNAGKNAQIVIAQDAGFGSWAALMQAVATGAPPQGASYAIDTKEKQDRAAAANDRYGLG